MGSSNPRFYRTYSQSPFKNYLKIADNVFVARKEGKGNSCRPSGITGTEVFNSMAEKQASKELELQRKKERQEIRERKKADKEASGKKGKKKKIAEQNRVEVTYADDSNEDSSPDKSNDCLACGRNENQDVDDVWIGCNVCHGWFHKYCLGENLEGLTQSEIQDLDFVCTLCTKMKKKKQKK